MSVVFRVTTINPFVMAEDAPATDRRADELYFAEVEQCDIYPGLFGNKYGYEDADVLTPTEREFDAATWLSFVANVYTNAYH